MAEHPEGSYTLLDMARQPSEYEQEHLPGAKLIPLGGLRCHPLAEIDKDKPVIAY